MSDTKETKIESGDLLFISLQIIDKDLKRVAMLSNPKKYPLAEVLYGE